MIKYLALLSALFFSTAALSHSFFSSYCCDGKDCLPEPCDALIETDQGIELTKDGKKYTFPRNHIYPSEDSKCYACIWNGNPRCVYIIQSF